MTSQPSSNFIDAYHGRLASILKWEELDQFWQLLKDVSHGDWYIYIPGEIPPDNPASEDVFDHFLDEINERLKKEHQEDYCGIVYVDNRNAPRLVKIYDPGNLGVVCGYSDNPPQPGWVLSCYKPVSITHKRPASTNTRPWWQRLFT